MSRSNRTPWSEIVFGGWVVGRGGFGWFLGRKGYRKYGQFRLDTAVVAMLG